MSTTFKDTKGMTWGINLTIGKAMKLREQTGLDLVKALSDIGTAYTVIGQMEEDLLLFCTVFHTLVDAQEKGVSVEDFAAVMNGDVVNDAFEALDQAFTNFYPPEKRETVLQMKQKIQSGLGESQEQIIEELERRLPEVKQKMHQAIKTKLDLLTSGD